jgi:hypothetical protein
MNTEIRYAKEGLFAILRENRQWMKSQQKLPFANLIVTKRSVR